MIASLSVQDFIKQITRGLEQRQLNFILSQDALGYQLVEIFITGARELILVPNVLLNQAVIRWILEIRTPINVRLTIFTHDVIDYKVRIMRAVNDLKNNGIQIPDLEHAISIQEISNTSLQRLLDSLDNWQDLKTNGRPLPHLLPLRTNSEGISMPAKSPLLPRQQQHPLPDVSPQPTSKSRLSQFSLNGNHDLYTHLRSAIKTYWTERYLSKYLNLPPARVKELARRIGVRREVCGQEVLYYFNRAEALIAYFKHIVKGILDELELSYQETENHSFFLPNFRLAIMFFNDAKEKLRVLAEVYAGTYELIFIVPEELRLLIGKIQDDFFTVLPLACGQIRKVLKQLTHQRVTYVTPAYRED